MTMTSRRHPKARKSLFDVHPVTGISIEVFWADTALETFGRGGAGWFWHVRLRGLAPDGPAHGPYSTSYSAYRDAFGAISAAALSPSISQPRQSGRS